MGDAISPPDASPPAFNGVILAGGASRRMGRDKGRYPVRGLPLLDHMRRLLRAAGARRIIVLGRPGEPDGRADRTPLAGPVPALLDYLDVQPCGSRHLVVPVDMPGLSPDLLARLAVQDRWAYYDGHPLPCLAVAAARPGPPPNSPSLNRLRDLLRTKQARHLPLPPGGTGQFANLNRPADVAAWLGHLTTAETTATTTAAAAPHEAVTGVSP